MLLFYERYIAAAKAIYLQSDVCADQRRQETQIRSAAESTAESVKEKP